MKMEKEPTKFKTGILANEPQPDVILLDLNMPVWDGQILDEFIQIPDKKTITILS
jgi:CheY-like chemotaxis protein